MMLVAGYCPMGCGATLFIGEGGHITCSYTRCPNPAAVDEILGERDSDHVLEVRTAQKLLEQQGEINSLKSRLTEVEEALRHGHEALDHEEVPRDDDSGRPISLALRVAVLADELREAARS